MPSWGIALLPPKPGPIAPPGAELILLKPIVDDAQQIGRLPAGVVPAAPWRRSPRLDRRRAAATAPRRRRRRFPVRDAGVPSYGAQSHGVDSGGHMAATSSKLPGAHSVASSPGLAKMGVIRIDAIFQAPFALRYSSV